MAHSRLLLLLAALPLACTTIASRPETDTSENELRALGANEDLGPIAFGETKSLYYTNPPFYRAYHFTASAGTKLSAWARSTDGGDAKAWFVLPGAVWKNLAFNDDADATTTDAHVTTVAPVTGTYYVVVRDAIGSDAAFDVTLEAPFTNADAGTDASPDADADAPADASTDADADAPADASTDADAGTDAATPPAWAPVTDVQTTPNIKFQRRWLFHELEQGMRCTFTPEEADTFAEWKGYANIDFEAPGQDWSQLVAHVTVGFTDMLAGLHGGTVPLPSLGADARVDLSTASGDAVSFKPLNGASFTLDSSYKARCAAVTFVGNAVTAQGLAYTADCRVSWCN